MLPFAISKAYTNSSNLLFYQTTHLPNNQYKPVDEAFGEITQQIADSYIYYQYSHDGIEWHDEVRASDRYMRQRKGENGEWGAAMAFGRDGKDAQFFTIEVIKGSSHYRRGQGFVFDR